MRGEESMSARTASGQDDRFHQPRYAYLFGKVKYVVYADAVFNYRELMLWYSAGIGQLDLKSSVILQTRRGGAFRCQSPYHTRITAGFQEITC